MANRKKIVVAFLLCAMLLISVGFAAVTNVLDITGSATVSGNAASEEFNEDIYFKGVVNPNNSDVVNSIDASAGLTYTANINTNNNDKAQFTVTGITAIGEKAVITYQINNDSEYAANVSIKLDPNKGNAPSITNSNDTYFDFDYYFAGEGVQTATIQPHQSATVSVVVTLIKQVTDAENGATASFLLELNAVAG